MILWTFGMCFTWPTLEALISEKETRGGLAQMVGIYNIVWASGADLAYFTGGAILEKLGRQSLFWLPAALHALQFGLVLWLPKKSSVPDSPAVQDCGVRAAGTPVDPPADSVSAPVARSFLRMAWLANPFAYIAMNTVIPLLPDLAARMDLSTTSAGFVGSVWMFARLFAFIGLWRWTGWHYRFNWLAGAYILMVLSFTAMLMVPVLAVIVAAEFSFGLAVGLIYYSSLFYSMDVGETKGEHGGFHEALIGLGLFAGPAVGAISLTVFPGAAHGGIGAVSATLLVGLALLTLMKRAGR
jgi:MFS family permease